MIGTIPDVSPEQASGQPVDARSDIFSFGVVVYELLSGRRPFAGATDLETLQIVIHGAPEPLGDDLPVALRLIRRFVPCVPMEIPSKSPKSGCVSKENAFAFSLTARDCSTCKDYYRIKTFGASISLPSRLAGSLVLTVVPPCARLTSRPMANRSCSTGCVKTPTSS